MAKKKVSVEEESNDGKEVPNYSNVIKDKSKLLKQYLREKDYAVKLRQTKVNNFIKNEESYNGVIQKTLLTRSNLHVPMVFEGVQSMSSRLGTAPDLEYDTIPEGDDNAGEIMEHVVKEDLESSFWDSIFDASKIEAGIYGRTIYKVIPGNDKNKVELVDTLAYLISPIGKHTKTALYQGQQFIYKTYEQLEEEKDEMEYDEEELAKLKRGEIPNETQQDASSEASLKNLRMANLGMANVTQYGSKVVELTEWWTYVKKGKKSQLYSLTVANDMYVIRAKSAKELGLTGKAARPPFFSWGTFTRGIIFWCPSIADVYRDPNLAADVALNQVIDNNTYRNFGMLFVGSGSGLKQSSIVPRPLGITPVNLGPDEKISDKVWQMPIEEISSGLAIMQTVKGFADAAAGLAPGQQQQKGKMSVTQLAKLNADIEAKISGMRRNATLCCQEMYQFMADITSEKLTKPRKVKIFGYKNLTLEDVTKKNFVGVKLVAKAIPAEDNEQNKAIKQKAKIDLYTLFKDDPKIPGQIAMRRSVAKTFDIEPDEIESWFTEEEKPDPSMAEGLNKQPEQGQASQPANGDTPPQSPAGPLISATQQGAQAQVPPAIRP